MSIIVPKEHRSLGFTDLIPVELNDTDVDRMLPHIYELAVKGGRVASYRTNAREYDKYFALLADRDDLVGFDDDRSKAVLDGWLRSSVVRMGRAGLDRRTAQMDHVRPLTIASYRSGLPSRSRHRRADVLTHALLVEELGHRALTPREGRVGTPLDEVRSRLVHAVGQGVRISDPPAWTPTYDGSTTVDINALLSLRFLEGFTEALATKGEPHEKSYSAVPGATSPLGRDLVDYLLGYGARVPPATFVTHFAGLLALRLFQLPLRTALATRALLASGVPAQDMIDTHGADPLEQYCDFTRERGSGSDELARACVQRDLDILRGFFPDRLKLRTISMAMSMLGADGAAIHDLPGHERFVRMLEKTDEPLVQAYCAVLLQRIETETKESGADEESVALIQQIQRSGLTPLEQVTDVLVEGLRKRGYENQVKWFWSTGAITKEYGLLDGTLKARRSWRYAPRDSLLEALLAVAFVTAGGARVRPSMPISEILEVLDQRFGLLVDRPPAALDNVETRAAAAENLEAFKRRLHLLGAFDSLSDDFSAQSVRNPWGIEK